MRRLLPAATLLLVPTAGAALSVESAPVADRARAEEIAGEASGGLGEGVHATIVRRFTRGKGWGYVVLVDGLGDPSAAGDLARRFEQSSGAGSIFDVVDGERVKVGPDGPPPPASPAPPAKQEARRPAPADPVLRAAVRAHGGREGGLVRLGQAPVVRFEFRRTISVGNGALVAWHDYRRADRAVVVEVKVEEGDGRDSRTLVTAGDEAWVTLGERSVARDPVRTREVLARFSPEKVLAVPLGLPVDVEGAQAWRDLVRAPDDASGDTLVVVPRERPAGAGLLEAAFSARTDHLVRLVWRDEQGPTTYRYDDYRAVAEGLVVPFLAECTREGRLVERVEILRFELDQVPDPARFAVPAAVDTAPDRR